MQDKKRDSKFPRAPTDPEKRRMFAIVDRETARAMLARRAETEAQYKAAKVLRDLMIRHRFINQ